MPNPFEPRKMRPDQEPSDDWSDDAADVGPSELWEQELDQVTIPCKRCGAPLVKVSGYVERWTHQDEIEFDHRPEVEIIEMAKSIKTGRFSAVSVKVGR